MVRGRQTEEIVNLTFEQARQVPARSERREGTLTFVKGHRAEGSDNSTVCRRLRMSPTTVSKWRARFLKKRVAGLFDEPRPGAPRQINDASIEQVIIRTLESKPRGATHWSTRSMAKAIGFSHMTISRVWRAFGLQPHQSETLKLSPDPLLIEKVRDIVGLYMNPPDHAVVLCVDEKSQIQALDRTAPLLPM